MGLGFLDYFSPQPLGAPFFVFFGPGLDGRGGAEGRDGFGVDVRVAFAVVFFDVLEVDG